MSFWKELHAGVQWAITVVVVVAILSTGIFFVWKFFYPEALQVEHEANQNSPQKQSALIQEAENLLDGIDDAAGEQRKLLTERFCRTVKRLSTTPTDIENAQDGLCKKEN